MNAPCATTPGHGPGAACPAKRHRPETALARVLFDTVAASPGVVSRAGMGGQITGLIAAEVAARLPLEAADITTALQLLPALEVGMLAGLQSREGGA